MNVLRECVISAAKSQGRAAARAAWAAVLAAAGAASQAGPPAATSLFPAGGGRGQTVEVTAAGTFDAWPVQVWVDGPGLEVEPAAEKGKLAVRVAADASPGLRWIRLYDAAGASAPLPFEIGGAPGLAEAEPNDGPESHQLVAGLPVTVDGRFGKNGDVDGFAVDVEAGQTLVASLKGHRLGSPTDAVLQLVSPAGFVVAQADDEAGLDPRIVFEAPEPGRYVVRGFAFPAEPNSTIGFAGGEAYVYRLTLTTGPFADLASPLAVTEGGGPLEVETSGWNLGEAVGRLTVEPPGGGGRARAWHADLPEALELPVLPMPVAVESGFAAPAVDGGEPRRLVPPAAVSGTIAVDAEEDVYHLTGVKGQTLSLRARAREFGSPLDPVLRVLDADGETLAEQDDAGGGGRDPELSFAVPADGEYRVSVSDLTGRGGPRSVYLLEATEPRPDFRLTLAADRFAAAPGKPAEIAVTVTREGGFDRPVELSVLGLPEGVTAAPATDAPPEDATAEKPEEKRGRRRKGGEATGATVTLTLTAAEGAAAFSGPVTVLGRAAGDGEPREREAAVALPAPGRETTRVWLTVAPGP